MTLAFLAFIAALVVLAAVVAFALKPRAEVWTSKSPARPREGSSGTEER